MFSCRREIVVNATPERVFSIISDVERHADLAGSKEVLKVRKLTPGPVGMGTEFEADEDIKEPRMVRAKFTAKSTVNRFEPGKAFGWRIHPPVGPKSTIDWVYLLEPQGNAVKLTETIKVRVHNPVMDLMATLPYSWTRGKIVARGMEKTLANVKAAAEQVAPAGDR